MSNITSNRSSLYHVSFESEPFLIRADRLSALSDVYSAMDRTRIYDGQIFKTMYMTSFIQYLILLKWQVKAVPTMHGWLEIDTADDLSLYERLKREGRLDALCQLI